MGLAEVREKINEVDAELMALLDKRAECSSKVAAAKLGSGDLIYKPEREREICDKFSNVGNGMGENVAKTIMRNSRLIQYEMYSDEGIVPEKFLKMMANVGNDAFSRNMASSVQTAGEDIKIDIKIDFEDNNKNKLDRSDILSILAESGFKIKEIKMSENKIETTLVIGNDDADRKKAYVLLFMLYMETVNLEVK